MQQFRNTKNELVGVCWLVGLTCQDNAIPFTIIVQKKRRTSAVERIKALINIWYCFFDTYTLNVMSESLHATWLQPGAFFIIPQLSLKISKQLKKPENSSVSADSGRPLVAVVIQFLRGIWWIRNQTFPLAAPHHSGFVNVNQSAH